MALLRLERHEAENGRLPPVCIRCGAPAVVWREKGFVFESPDQGGGLPGLLTALLLAVFLGGLWIFRFPSMRRGRVWLRAPFCAAHAHHWLWRTLIIPGALTLLILLSCTGLFTLPNSGWFETDGKAIAFVLIYGFLTFLAWCVVAVIAHETSVHSNHVSDNDIVLKRVSQDFIDALERQRHGGKGKQHAPGSP